MAKKILPANISILNTSTKERLGLIRQVKNLNIFEGSNSNFDPDGLYSVETFGRVGEKARMTTFGYIDTGVQILHPGIFDAVCRLKGLYKGILSGKAYATWNASARDFEKSNELEGDTGYAFFMSHWKDLKFRKSKSPKRELLIKLVDTARDDALVRYVLVMPAGLRDLQTDQDTGRQTEDEINDYYRKLISISQTVDSTETSMSSKFNDNARWAAQTAFNNIYQTVFQMLEGKNGFIQAKWASRRVFNATRNVITSMDIGAGDLGGLTNPKAIDTVVGMFQCLKGALPLTQRCLRETWLEGVTIGMEETILFDPKTYEPKRVMLSNDTLNKWSTQDGLEKLINGFKNFKLRHKPVTIESALLALVYENEEGIKIVRPNDIDSIPDDIRDGRKLTEFLRPLTWAEFYYYACYDMFKRIGGTVTRYPIAGPGSIYVTKLYVKTTTPGRVVRELGDDWRFKSHDESRWFNEWPTYGEEFMDSMQPYPTRHAGLAADHDGDTMSLIIVCTEDAMREIDEYFASIESVLDPTGGFQASIAIDVVEWVMTAATAD